MLRGLGSRGDCSGPGKCASFSPSTGGVSLLSAVKCLPKLGGANLDFVTTAFCVGARGRRMISASTMGLGICVWAGGAGAVAKTSGSVCQGLCGAAARGGSNEASPGAAICTKISGAGAAAGGSSLCGSVSGVGARSLGGVSAVREEAGSKAGATLISSGKAAPSNTGMEKTGCGSKSSCRTGAVKNMPLVEAPKGAPSFRLGRGSTPRVHAASAARVGGVSCAWGGGGGMTGSSCGAGVGICTGTGSVSRAKEWADGGRLGTSSASSSRNDWGR